MTRYEGMDDLLHRVRERLGVAERAVDPPLEPHHQRQAHATAHETLQQLRRDAEQAHALLEVERPRALTEEEYEELRVILGKVLRELWQCRVALERLRPDR